MSRVTGRDESRGLKGDRIQSLRETKLHVSRWLYQPYPGNRPVASHFLFATHLMLNALKVQTNSAVQAESRQIFFFELLQTQQLGTKFIKRQKPERARASIF